MSEIRRAARDHAAALADAVDDLSAPVFFLDRAGHAILFNRAAEDLVADGALSTAAGRLRAADQSADAALGAALAAATDPATPLASDVLLPRPDGTPLALAVRPADADGVAATVFVTDPGRGLASAAEHCARLFRLSRNEARLLAALLDGTGLTRAAGTLGVARTTARTYLGRIYRKTGTTSPGALIALAAGFASPVRS